MKFFKTGTRAKLIFLAVLALTVLALPATAFAHPLGNFTVNQYSRIEVGSAGVNVFFVLDMAEIPTFQEKDLIDQNKDGQISADESSQYADARTKQILTNLKLAINGAPAQMNIVSDSMSFIAGQGNLQTLRLVAHFQTAALASDASQVSYSDSNYADRIGWREIILRNATGVAVTQASVPDKDQTNELRVYPEDMLASPLQVTSAQASFKLDPSIVINRNDYPQDAEVIKTQDPLANLINGELTLPVILFALLAAVVLGMFHALSPGHGKTVVAAYLVGSRGTAKHAVFLGLTVTVTHTIGVFALGLITLFASQYILPETLYPWLGLLSGLLVVGMGISLFRSRLLSTRRSARATSGLAEHSHSHDSFALADHDHDHADHDHSHDSFALAGHTHSHDDHTHTHDDHSHDHAHPAAVAHTHSHDEHTHSHDDHDHSHDHEHVHTHEAAPEKAEILTIKRPALEPALAMTGAADGGVTAVEMRSATLEPLTEVAHPHSSALATHDHAHDHDHSHDGHSHDSHSHTHDDHPVAVAFAPAPHTHSHDDHDGHTHSHADHDHDHSHDAHSHADHDHDHSHSHDDHDHEHVHTLAAHDHSHDGHDHSHDHDHTHSHADADHDHDHAHADGTMHSHGGKMHSHLPPGTDNKPVTWKNLLLFGISAGLLPCPSALVLMLSAIGLNRTALGLILVVFFSAGLAGTLTGIGLLMVYARDRFSRIKEGRFTRVMRFLPIVSAALVAILGLALTWTGLIQTGLIK